MPGVHDAIRMKVVLVGSTGVGKTCISNMFVDNEFIHTDLTTGFDIATKIVPLGPTTHSTTKIQIWDLSGQWSFRSVTAQYYRGANIAIYVYDMTRRDTFLDVLAWIEEVKNNIGSDVIVAAICGNKKDLQHKRMVTENEARQLASEHAVYYFETSVYYPETIEKIFDSLVKRYYFLYEHSSEHNRKSTMKKRCCSCSLF